MRVIHHLPPRRGELGDRIPVEVEAAYWARESQPDAAREIQTDEPLQNQAESFLVVAAMLLGVTFWILKRRDA